MPIMQLTMIWNTLWKGVTVAEQVLAERSRVACGPCCSPHGTHPPICISGAAHEESDRDWKHMNTCAYFSHWSVSMSADTQKNKKKRGRNSMLQGRNKHPLSVSTNRQKMVILQKDFLIHITFPPLEKPSVGHEN